MENPGTASWGLTISDADFEKLKRGIRARDMDDRWVFKPMKDEELPVRAPSNRVTIDGEPLNPTAVDEATTEEELTDEALQVAEVSDQEPMVDSTKNKPASDLHQGVNISIRRSWTDRELYRLAVKPSEGRISAKIEFVTWEQNQGDHISEEQAKIDIVILCRQIPECDFAAAPGYDHLLFSAFPRSATKDSTTARNETD